MAVLQLLKRSNLTAAVPTTAQLKLGELALNTFDGRLFTVKNNGVASITEFVSTTGTFSGALAAISGTIDTIPISRGFGGFSGNVAIGTGALSLLSGTKFDNIAIGTNALKNNGLSSQNIAIGTNAGLNINNINAGNNIAIGYNSLSININGLNNIAMGTNALGSNTATTGSIAIGSNAGFNATTGGNNIFLGNNTAPLTATDTNSIVFGNNAVGLGSNSVVLGNTATTISKIWGIPSLDSSIVTAPGSVFSINKPQGIITCSLATNITVNNTFVTANSVVLVQLRNQPSPATATIRHIVVVNGSFTITFNATPIAVNPIVSFTVLGTT
jgi:hypothetical protein